MSVEVEYVADKSVHTHPFTIVYNQLINSSLPPDTCFMLIYMCSKPPKWEFHEHMLLERLQCGKDKLQRMRKEAREAGYMRLESIPSGKGDGRYIGTRYLFSGRPIFQSTENGIFRESAEPGVGQSRSHSSNTERLSNTERTTTLARASINQVPPPEAKAFVAAVVNAEKKKVANGCEFVFEEQTDQLVIDLGRIDVSNTQAVMAIQKYGRQRIEEVLKMAQDNATTNPGGYFRNALVGGWKPKTQQKPASNEPTKASAALQETQKLLSDSVEHEKRIKSSEEARMAREESMAKIRGMLGRKPKQMLTHCT